jgi:hypothetical protein
MIDVLVFPSYSAVPGQVIKTCIGQLQVALQSSRINLAQMCRHWPGSTPASLPVKTHRCKLRTPLPFLLAWECRKRVPVFQQF